MIGRFEQVHRYPAVFRSLTGMRVENFAQLWQDMQAAMIAAQRTRLDRDDRRHAPGGGGHATLNLRPPFFQALWDGLALLLRQPYLRTIVVMAWSFDLGWNILYAVYTLYVLRVLGLPPAAYGLIFGVGSLGAFVAALLLSTASTVSGITAGSLIQALTPGPVLGRVAASRQALGLLPAVMGTALGGPAGSVWGIAPTVLLGASLSSISFLWLLVSPLRQLQQLPDQAT